MIEYDSVETMQKIFKLERNEASEIADRFPGYLADKLASKFVETHWKEISQDKKLMAEIKQLTVNRTVALIATMLEQQVAKALGVKTGSKHK